MCMEMGNDGVERHRNTRWEVRGRVAELMWALVCVILGTVEAGSRDDILRGRYVGDALRLAG